MEFLPIERPVEAEPDDLTADQIKSMCQRAFGIMANIVSARELGGGTFNRTFLVNINDQQVILRIAPPSTTKLSWDEQWLMRRENTIQPFFASVAAWMPRPLMADFTHQIIDRDYAFQSYLAGERWDAVAEELTLDEQLRLWGQFGAITRAIHLTTGTFFGGPYPAQEFRTWSQTVIDRLECALRAMVEAQLDASELQLILDLVRGKPDRLDEIQQPRLLHGDLWLFNILVRRNADGPDITGILDADRAWWGDPLADWTLFVLSKSASPENQPFHAVFWQTYGQTENTPGAAFRKYVYEAMHVGTALSWAARHHDEETLERGKHDLHAAATILPNL